MNIFSANSLLGDFLVAHKPKGGQWTIFTQPSFDTYDEAMNYVETKLESQEVLILQVTGQFQAVSKYHEVHPLHG